MDSKKSERLKKFMLFFDDQNFNLGGSEKQIVQAIQFLYDAYIVLFSVLIRRLKMEDLRIFISLLLAFSFFRILIEKKISLSQIAKKSIRNLFIVFISCFIAVKITGDPKLTINVENAIITFIYIWTPLLLSAVFFYIPQKAALSKYRLIIFALLIGSILSFFYVLMFRERAHEFVIAIIISTVVFFFDHSYYRHFGKI